MRIAICPGSFDPVTKGHVDIIRRASKLFDKVIVVVMVNFNKPDSYFTADERVNLIRKSISDIENAEVDTSGGLLADYAESKGACAVVKGLRAVTDFDYELQLAQTNRKLADNVDTIFLTTSLQYAYLSSSTVKEVASFGGDISKFVPGFVADLVYEKFKK